MLDYKQPLQTGLTRWHESLLKPVDGSSLALFRIGFGLIMFWEVIRYYQHGWIERYFIQPSFYFTYHFFDFVTPWPGRGMYLHFDVVGILAILIAVGLFYRVAALLFLPAFAYIFLLDKANYLNHFYLIILFSFLLCLLPANRALSLDRVLFFPRRPALVPMWSVWVLRAQQVIVYFYAGLAKVNVDWLRGEPMRMWLAARDDFPLVGHWFTEEWVVYLFSYGALIFDLSVGFLFLWRKTRLVAFGFAGTFHLMNAWLFNIGIFPWMMIWAMLIFAEPDWPQTVWGWIRQKIRLPARGDAAPLPETFGYPIPRTSTLILIGLHGYFIFQLLFPLRHLLYPGNVSWTEEGHRFSWHMKLRDKDAMLNIYLTDPRTGDTWEISPSRDLSSRQLKEMSTRPDMIVQYAHYLAAQAENSGQPRPIIQVNHQVSLNGRPYQTLIDPEVNLAEIQLSFKPADWLLPLADISIISK